jgi:hypothetical protein
MSFLIYGPEYISSKLLSKRAAFSKTAPRDQTSFLAKTISGSYVN